MHLDYGSRLATPLLHYLIGFHLPLCCRIPNRHNTFSVPAPHFAVLLFFFILRPIKSVKRTLNRIFASFPFLLFPQGFGMIAFDCREHGISHTKGQGLGYGTREAEDVAAVVNYARSLAHVYLSVPPSISMLTRQDFMLSAYLILSPLSFRMYVCAVYIVYVDGVLPPARPRAPHNVLRIQKNGSQLRARHSRRHLPGRLLVHHRRRGLSPPKCGAHCRREPVVPPGCAAQTHCHKALCSGHFSGSGNGAHGQPPHRDFKRVVSRRSALLWMVRSSGF